MEVKEMNKCLSKFYVSVRRKDGSYYKRNRLLSVRAATKGVSARCFYNHPSTYTKTIIRLRVGEYSLRLLRIIVKYFVYLHMCYAYLEPESELVLETKIERYFRSRSICYWHGFTSYVAHVVHLRLFFSPFLVFFKILPFSCHFFKKA